MPEIDDYLAGLLGAGTAAVAFPGCWPGDLLIPRIAARR
jgi:hypothetical protein